MVIAWVLCRYLAVLLALVDLLSHQLDVAALLGHQGLNLPEGGPQLGVLPL